MDLGLSNERESDQPAPDDGTAPVHLPGDSRHRARTGHLSERGILQGDSDTLDRLAPFRSAILGIRWGTAGIGLVLTVVNTNQSSILTWVWCIVIIAQAAYRVMRPVR